jgi:hypothetical protein
MVEQMLQQFFTFYSTYSASHFALSPWLGQLQTRNQANAVVFSISDPFEHDHNLTGNLSHANWSKFQDECSRANQILIEAARKRQHKAWGLSLILTRKALPATNFQHRPSHFNHTIEWGTHFNDVHDRLKYLMTDILLFETVTHDAIRKKRSVSPEVMEDTLQVTPNILAEQLEETLSAKRRRMDDDGSALTPISDSEENRHCLDREKIYFQVRIDCNVEQELRLCCVVDSLSNLARSTTCQARDRS